MVQADWQGIDNKLVDPEWYPSGEYLDVFKLMRDEDPLHWTTPTTYGKPFWSLTRYSDIEVMLNDSLMYSNYRDTRLPRVADRVPAGKRYELAIDVILTSMDPPYHSLYRRPVNKHFSVPAISRLAEHVRETVDFLIDSVADRGECDFVNDIGSHLPMRVILQMLGVPAADWDEIVLNSWRFFIPSDPKFAIPGLTPMETYEQGLGFIADYARNLVKLRRENPQDDFATVLAEMEVDGVPLDDHEVVGWFVSMMTGGLDTTRNTASVGLWLLLSHPAQKQKLLANPDLIDNTVEEVLRWATPAKNRMRVARADHELLGKKIKAGDWMIAFLVSANHDERVFENPDEFDIERTNLKDHLSFGSGPHTCLGRSLARLELTMMMPRFLRAFPDLELVNPGEPHWAVDHVVTGLSDLPLRWSKVEATK